MKKRLKINKILGIVIVVLIVVILMLIGMISKKWYGFDNKSVQSLKNTVENKIETNDDAYVGQNNDEKQDSVVSNEAKIEKKDNEIKKQEEQKDKIKQDESKQDKTQNTPMKSKEENDKDNQTQKNAAKSSKIIVIDPGHQVKGDSSKEPIGPGATETKAKVTGGATGVATKQTEYELNLKVALLLQKKLQEKGYTVKMTRTTNNVNISNKERAEIANNANAAAFIRIHANSLNDSSVKGILTMCQTANNPYNGNLASESYRLSKSVLDNVVKTTGGINKGVTRTDTMSGINWCKVPTTIIEMGFLSNPDEDKLMSTSSYQEKIVDGIVNGIEEYLK